MVFFYSTKAFKGEFMEEDFKKGDTVKLKSGGPLMTVVDIDELGVECMWFDKAEKKFIDTFEAATLKKAKPGMNISEEAMGVVVSKSSGKKTLY